MWANWQKFRFCTIDDVGKQVIQGGFETGCIVNVSDVKSAVKRLKAHKMMGITVCQLIIYTVNHKNVTFLIITLANLNRFL